ncbi:MAG: hypothetical protein WEC59_08655 [Salibacteraceae bacterium]
MTKWFLALFLLASTHLSWGQKTIADSAINFFAISAELGLQVPFGDMADRFGAGGIAGGSIMYKSKENWTFEGNFGFLFGQNINEDTILKPLITEQNFIIGRDGNPADVLLYQRGFVATVRVGKIFPVIGPNPNSGIHLALGAGVMQHKIQIQDAFENIPQIAGEYKKGYDRLTNGFTLSQSIGYQHFSDYRFFNFYIGAEFYEGFTQNRRSLNFDTGLRDDRQRLDVVGSLVIRWYFPIYKRKPKEFYFY